MKRCYDLNHGLSSGFSMLYDPGTKHYDMSISWYHWIMKNSPLINLPGLIK